MWEHGRSLPSLIAGLVLGALGLIPLLGQYNIIGFALPAALTGIIASIVLYIIAAGGVYLLIDAFLEWGENIAWVTLVVALIVLVIGFIPLLNKFGVIAFGIPLLSMTIYYAIFVIEGVFLIIAAFAMQ